MTVRVLFDAAVAGYLLGTLLSLAHLAWGGPRLARAARAVTLVGLAAHTGSLAARVAEAHVAPAAGLYDAVSFLAWAIIVASILFQRRYRLQVLGAFATPLAALLLLAASSAPSLPRPPEPTLQSVWLPVHVTLVFAGDALLALAACAGLMYLLQERTLKTKQVGPLTRRLPSLEALDALNLRSLTLGFPLLTLGLLTGAVWARLAWGSFWSWEPKVVLSVLTWVLYAVLLHGRLTVGWRGRRAAVGAIAGFVAVLFTLVGVGLFRAAGGRGLA
jgi:cytochrome c-type biogenesis protein CcsB